MWCLSVEALLSVKSVNSVSIRTFLFSICVAVERAGDGWVQLAEDRSLRVPNKHS